MSIAAIDEKAVGIVALGQRDAAHVYAPLSKPAGKRLCRLLTAAVDVGIKGQIDGSRTIA